MYLQDKIHIIIVITYLWNMDTKFNYRNTTEEDYEIMKDWWKWHRFKAPQRHILPDNFSDGLMISHEGENLCSGFIYRTSSSSLFWIEWIVSTYKVRDKELRAESLRFLISGLMYMAKQSGAKVIYTSLINPHLKQAYLDCGFVVGSKSADELVCVLD